MAVTGKQTKYGMESFFLVPKENLTKLVPHGLSLFSRFGYGPISIGAWYHTNAYVDDQSYGPVLEAWVAVETQHENKPHAVPLFTYNNSQKYSEPVNTIFKFSKEYADLRWKEDTGKHVLEVWKNDQLILRFSGRATWIPKSIPYSRPRSCWLIKGNDAYIAEIDMVPTKSRIALTSIDIPDNSPLRDVAALLRGRLKLSVFFNDASLRIPEPTKVPT
jgi:hypothetical protein